MANSSNKKNTGTTAGVLLPDNELVTQLKRCTQLNDDSLSCALIVNKLHGKTQKINEQRLKNLLEKFS